MEITNTLNAEAIVMLLNISFKGDSYKASTYVRMYIIPLCFQGCYNLVQLCIDQTRC